MNNVLRIILSFILAISWLKCSKSTNEFENMHLYYLSPDVMTQFDVNCKGGIFRHYNLLDDTLIQDKRKIQKIYKKIQELDTTKDDYTVDVRIYSYIEYTDDNRAKDTLCFDKFGNIIFNGEKMKKNDKLFNLVKDIVWK